ncbi:MAG: MBOAT family protein [Desulfovibrio sp.]|nr:MBOAT family protein [Desulfovibrio sp.]
MGVAHEAWVLLVFSALFYLINDALSFCLLAVQISINYAFALGFSSKAMGGRRKALLVGALICNLLPLLYCKYSTFFVELLGQVAGTPIAWTHPTLPPGISFYTFIQIAWLVSVYKGSIVPEGFGRHALFSTFFPVILSGPIVRYEQMGAQFDRLPQPTWESLASGFSLFILGLGKKLIIADGLAPLANAVFGACEKGWPVLGGEAWLGTLAYTFQLYFDFSGYTDMAIGIGLMLGLQLPENFISPYKSTGIVDFWRRWHITLGLWLRDFLYIPLGGNRKGRLRQYGNLFLTMVIGGAWHGAGWPFLVWGALHGLMLTINHAFRQSIRDTPVAPVLQRLPFRIFFIALTFFCLHCCWVFFRAESLSTACTLLQTMMTGPFVADGLDGTLQGFLPNHYVQSWYPVFLLGLSAILVWGFPCTHEIFAKKDPSLQAWLRFRLTKAWAIGLSLLFVASLVLSKEAPAFLYFQF